MRRLTCYNAQARVFAKVVFHRNSFIAMDCAPATGGVPSLTSHVTGSGAGREPPRRGFLILADRLQFGSRPRLSARGEIRAVPTGRLRGYAGLAMRRQSDEQGPSLSGGFGPGPVS